MKSQLAIEKKPGCIAAALEILGDKWTPLLLKELVANPLTFSEMEAAVENISPRILSQRLERLIDEDIAERRLYCEKPPRYRYYITPKGAALEEILRAMAKWGDKYGCD